ncbi:MAG: hypothetical protein ACLP8Y_06755 [Thermoplasmata archaeon]
MKDDVRVTPIFEFEAFGAAVGSAVVCGALSLVVPLLIAPTATLVCLALAAWVSTSRRRGPLTFSGLGNSSLASLCVLGGSAAGFLTAPSFLAPFRGLLLAGGLVPLFLAERTRSMHPFPVFTRS